MRRDVLGQAVGHEDVLVTVEVEVGDQGRPAPVGAGDAALPGDVAERAVAVVVLEHVAHELVVEPLARLGLIQLPGFVRRRGLQPVVVRRQHVGRVDVRPAIVVDVGDVDTHREVARQRHRLLEHLVEGPVALVDVQVVALEEVVRDVHVRPPIAVYVANGDPQPEADLGAVDPRLLAHVDEMAAVVPVQLVPA